MNKNTFKISIENSTFTLTKCKKCESECSVGGVATRRRQLITCDPLIILLPLTRNTKFVILPTDYHTDPCK